MIIDHYYEHIHKLLKNAVSNWGKWFYGWITDWTV